jgi:hypothetical protein
VLFVFGLLGQSTCAATEQTDNSGSAPTQTVPAREPTPAVTSSGKPPPIKASIKLRPLRWIGDTLRVEGDSNFPTGIVLIVAIRDAEDEYVEGVDGSFMRTETREGGHFVAEKRYVGNPFFSPRHTVMITTETPVLGNPANVLVEIPVTIPKSPGQHAAQRKSKKDAGFLRDPDMSQDEITFWANTIVVMVNSGELVMECDNHRAYINPDSWTAGEGGGVWSAQRRLARAILLACHGVSGADRVDIYDGETRQKLASYSRAGGYTQY